MRIPIIFEYSSPGKRSSSLPVARVPYADPKDAIPAHLLRKEPPALPEVSEPEIARHYTHLANLNHGVDTGFYPLGSCTMKYNPKINEEVSARPGFLELHPETPVELAQGTLEIMYRLERALCAITGMAAATLAPAAGAHGELTGLLIIRAALEDAGETDRTVMLIPDSAHGTNPASSVLAGFTPVTIRSDEKGMISLSALEEHLNDRLAGIMITNPNTLGVFEENIVTILRRVHEAGGYAYCDGANMNALLAKSRPGDVGFDVVQLNLHKTFSTPHGGGGPGSGPVLVAEHLAPYLPEPVISLRDGTYVLDRPAQSIGRVRSFHGNVGVMLKAFAYILSLGPDGLSAVADHAVLNASYLYSLIKDDFPVRYESPFLHEFVATASPLKAFGVRALDVAKALLDRGFHAPTIYFPLIVEEALMIEPTETESRATLEAFAGALEEIASLARTAPEALTSAPLTTPVARVDEARAARERVLRWRP